MIGELKHWALLEELDCFLSVDGWQERRTAIAGIEYLISQATGIAAHLSRPLDLAEPMLTEPEPLDDPEMPPTPFLRSRDAAALLEEALGPDVEISLTRETGGWTVNGIDQIAECQCRTRLTRLADDIHVHGSEAAARTRAALEAGWRIGLWPVKP